MNWTLVFSLAFLYAAFKMGFILQLLFALFWSFGLNILVWILGSLVGLPTYNSWFGTSESAYWYFMAWLLGGTAFMLLLIYRNKGKMY